MEQIPRKKYIDVLYNVSLVLKGANALIEIILGIITIFITQNFVTAIAAWVTADELIEDPKDTLANFLLNSAHHFSTQDKVFVLMYLLSHGVVKLFIVIALLKKKLWAYPLAFIVFGLFIFYQLYRYVYTHSLWLIALSLFDIFVLWLIGKEYRYTKDRFNIGV